jgi:hypothetical protein
VTPDDVLPQIRFAGILFVAARIIAGESRTGRIDIMAFGVNVQGRSGGKFRSTICYFKKLLIRLFSQENYLKTTYSLRDTGTFSFPCVGSIGAA